MLRTIRSDGKGGVVMQRNTDPVTLQPGRWAPQPVKQEVPANWWEQLTGLFQEC